MSREIQIDLANILQFIREYSLETLVSNGDFDGFISKQQKRYFAYLTYVSELSNFIDNKDYVEVIGSEQFIFITESCSDCGTAFFVSFHGGYKPAKLLLRSSIETFLKGYCLDFIPEIDKETSIYELFKRIKVLPFFKVDQNKKIINSIHNQYKLLCMDVHTATNANMSHISSLNNFPSFNKYKADKVANININLISSYISLLAIKYNEQYHLMHYKNKQIIIAVIPRELRPIINNIQ